MIEIKYPKIRAKNIYYRLKVKSQSINNKPMMVALYKKCQDDILFWINTFVMTYNPRIDPSVVPFITYEYQDEFILKLVDHIQNQKDILVDKSRDMGVSWCVLVVFTWFWQFEGEGKDFLCGSRKEEYVDRMGDMKTLLQKVRFVLKEQPIWLLPKGYKEQLHGTFLKIRNPVTNSVIAGESTNENFSRGGRQLGILFDEFAFWESDAPAWRSSADTTNCRIAVSTPHGFNNHFAKLRHSGSMDTTSLHWRLHPDKDQAWYDNECIRRNHDIVEISQELDISYEGSEEGVLFAWEDLNHAKTYEAPLSTDRIVITMDPATMGKDEAVIYVSNNGAIATKRFIKKATPEGLAAEVVMLVRKYHAQVVMADAIGNDILALVGVLMGDTRDKVKLVEFKSSEKADDVAKYYNRRAELYDNAAKAVMSGNVQVDDDYTLLKQLNATRYKTKNGRMIIVPKEEIKEKIGSSPDRADAWALIPEALKLTHSRREVEYKQEFRKRRNFDLVPTGQEYGDWGDTEKGLYNW